jgi:hypothetical protein
MLGAIIGSAAVLLIAILGSAARLGSRLGSIEAKMEDHGSRLGRLEEWQDYYDRDTRGRLYRRRTPDDHG